LTPSRDRSNKVSNVHEGAGPKYTIEIEGTPHAWGSDTISAAQIAELGGWPLSEGVVEIDLRTQEERTIGADETVPLRPGQGFAKKVRFKRG
jgi:hypothetical protein